MVTVDTNRKLKGTKKKKLVLKTGLAESGPFLTEEVPDMAKTSEPAFVQVCSLKLATSVRMFFFVFSLEHH